MFGMRLVFKLSIGAALVLLSGCFKSSVPLVVPAEADYPFQTITYEFAGEDDRVTLVGVGDSYEAPNEQGDGRLLLKKVDEGIFVLQAEIRDEDDPGFLYALARLAQDGKTAEIILPYARKSDHLAAQRGEAGFRPCSDDDDSVCLTDMAKYVEYALAKKPDTKRLVNILHMQ